MLKGTIKMIKPIGSGDRTKTSIFYINDFHGKSINMERAVSASKNFDNNKHQNTDILKFSSGDIMIGEGENTNKIAANFQNILDIDAAALGNHEFDLQEKLPHVLPEIKYTLLANNIKISQSNPLHNKVKSYTTIEKNGNKYGIIGTTPIDLYKHSKNGIIQKDTKLDGFKETLNDIQREINTLEKNGINKIILLSHLGYCLDKIVATQTQGIDVIIGGHSHDLVFDVKEGENLFYNKKGEPIVITQAGKDGENFGILNLEFDKNGVIKKIQNNIGFTKNFHRDMSAKYIFDKIFGNQKIYGKIKSAPPEPQNRLVNINPHAYFVADCIKSELNTDIVLLPSANIRGAFEQGEINTRTLSDIMPFKNKLYKMSYSEKEIVDGLKAGALSFKHTANKPGIFYTSGLEYTLTKTGKIKEVYFIDKNGIKTAINIDNPRTDKFYTTIINDYCALGNDNFAMFNHPERTIKKYPFDAVKCIADYMQKTNEPIEIKDDGRIKIIN